MVLYSALRWRFRSTASSNASLNANNGGSRNASDDDQDARLEWRPGQIIVYDYCDRKNSSNSLTSDTTSLKCIQWNIERGYHLDDVIATLKSHDADVICLQELDIHCARSNYRNAARELAEALQMTCVFIVEFEELYSTKRKRLRDQGGGWHGNAVLTRLSILSTHAIPHTHHPVDWKREGERLGEPRLGERVTLCVVVSFQERPIAVFSAHLEVFCGILGRLRQFKDILQHSHRLLSSSLHCQLIFGDLNTMGHGVARFHPRFCRDSLRWRTMGSSEAAWWHRHLFAFTTDMGPENERLRKFRQLTKDDLQMLRNPHFYDPVPPVQTTLRSVRGMFQGRLDWTLIRGLRCIDYGLDNHDYRKSDHKLMWVVVEVVEDDVIDSDAEAYDEYVGGDPSNTDADRLDAVDPGPVVYREQQVVQVIQSNFRRKTFWLLIVLVAVVAFTFGSNFNKERI